MATKIGRTNTKKEKKLQDRLDKKEKGSEYLYKP